MSPRAPIDLATPVEKAFLLAVDTGEDPGWTAEESIDELAALATTAGADVVGAEWQNRRHVDPNWYVGKGKAEELLQAKSETGFDILIADDELSPGQQKALEGLLKVKVIDRSRLILDIFAQHAQTHEGRLQVELAQLEYQLPRLTRMWTHLSRTQGGIGSRGPGESQLETDRRIIRERIKKMKERVENVRQQRETAARGRDRRLYATVAIVGYTNAGKSTLLNALTDAGVSVRDRLFETLDPTTRGFEHEGRRYLVTDTVGFVRRLPHQLVEGFAATLEETLVADLVLHVVDGSAPEQRLVEQIAAVDDVLREIGANELPVELVVNKIDAVDALGRRRLANRYPDALQISALTGEGLDELRARIAERFGERFERVRLLLPYEEGGRLNELYALGAPIDEREDTPEGVLVVARLPRRELHRYAPYLIAEEAPRRRRKGA
jgi:GTP-binding protein HflX